MLPKMIAIVGTNASGKSNLGVKLALKYGGEIVSADSRQVFEKLDLGSGKIRPEEMQGVPHHLLDVAKAGDFFSLANYQRLAYRAIDSILEQKKLPFLVGGTGLYISAVTDGYCLSDCAPDLAYRDELRRIPTDELYAMLLSKQPDVAVDPKNRNRVMRYLEKIHDGDTGHAESVKRYETLKLGVTWDRETLNRRIDERLEMRLQQGMVEEVQSLLDEGIDPVFMERLGLEYRFITWFLTGKIPTLQTMKEELAIAIKQFAKRQVTWFRRDKEIIYLDMQGDPYGEACRQIDTFLEKK